MRESGYQFIAAALGLDGANALKKASIQDPDFDGVLVPRSVMAWLALVKNDDFEDAIPGVPDTYLAFKKNERNYSGRITIGDDVYSFNGKSLIHLASAVAVALGVDGDSFSGDLEGLDLARLGKSIDLLAKARHCARLIDEERLLEKAISDIAPGPEFKDPKAATAKAFDYSHVLSPQHHKWGYKLTVRHSPESGTVRALVHKNGLEVGQVKGEHSDGALHIEDAEVEEQHQGRGLGTALYESLMAHAKHNGVGQVSGGVHSTSASGLHTKLARKHGLDYKQVPTPFPQLKARTPGPYDNSYGEYQYAIKEELPANTEKAESPGPAHQAQEPVGEQGPMPAQMQTQQAPQAKKPKLPKVPKQPKTTVLKITKAESEKACGVCGLGQFRGNTFRGCLCLRSMAKSITAYPAADGYDLFLGQDWDEDAIHALLESVGR